MTRRYASVAAAKVRNQYDLIQKANAEGGKDTDENRLEGDILFVKVDYRLVRINDIRYVESQSEYLRLYMTNSHPLMVLMSRIFQFFF